MVNIIERRDGKLLIIILLHFRLVTHRFHYWETPKPIICMVLGPGGRDHDSQNKYHLSLETPRHSKQSKKKPKPFIWENISVGNLRIVTFEDDS